ncbi:MAG: Gp19/Gp15/Gp42 family protein [Anaerovoracaceae bacterium]
MHRQSDEAVSQVSQTALGYSLSYSPLSPGGGLFVKRVELERLGLRRQRVRNLEII